MRDNIGKYRGQRKDGGEWVYGYYCEVGGTSFIIEEPTLMTMGMIGLYLSPLDMNEVIPETVGEFIGKKDKNDIEIHEGDKVRLRHGTHGREHIGIITWSQEGCKFYAREPKMKQFGWSLDTQFIEVIGNIHSGLK